MGRHCNLREVRGQQGGRTVKSAIISDIHGNHDALRLVLDIISALGIETVYCAGDVVGYGPDPGECIDLIRGRGIPCVMGNHDEAVATGRPRDRMRAEGLAVVHWTRSQLRDDQIQWLAGLPECIETEHFQVTHASTAHTPPWMYVADSESAVLHFLFQDIPVVFSGHTHVPLLIRHCSGQPPRVDLLESQLLPENHRFLVGVGAVGQPRDGDPRSSFVIYDTETNFLQLRRIAYDFTRTQARILTAGLPEMLAKRLTIGR